MADGKEAKRERFYFYISHWQILLSFKDLNKQRRLLKALGNYMFYDIEEDLQDEELKRLFISFKPNLDNYKTKSLANQKNGEKGKGIPKNAVHTESEKNNRFESKSEKNNRFESKNNLESEINNCLQS